MKRQKGCFSLAKNFPEKNWRIQYLLFTLYFKVLLI